jgi:hypothetical protein
MSSLSRDRGVGRGEVCAPRRKPPPKTWRTFFESHVKDIAPIDFFTVPAASFRVLYCFVFLRLDRHRVVHFNVRATPGHVDGNKNLGVFFGDTAQALRATRVTASRKASWISVDQHRRPRFSRDFEANLLALPPYMVGAEASEAP